LVFAVLPIATSTVSNSLTICNPHHQPSETLGDFGSEVLSHVTKIFPFACLTAFFGNARGMTLTLLCFFRLSTILPAMSWSNSINLPIPMSPTS
jgi:hypothetical protein